jgi:hypothetical protein
MMVTLRAISREDGLLLYEQEGAMFSLRPPWRVPQRMPAGADGRAVGDHGFEPADRSFVDLDALVAYARQEARAAAAERESDAPIAESLLRLAPESAHARYLERAQARLSAGKKDQAASSAGRKSESAS